MAVRHPLTFLSPVLRAAFRRSCRPQRMIAPLAEIIRENNHRIELEVLAGNSRAIDCYLACGFRQEGIRREAGLYPDGWKDFLLMGLLQSEHRSQAKTARAAGPGDARSAQ